MASETSNAAPETAPSAMTEDQVSLARTIGMTGLMAVLLGILILILNAANIRRPNGGGLIAVAGGAAQPEPDDAAHVGVFGQGGRELEHRVPVVGGTVVQGAPFPGAGVVGRGGDRRKKSGAGAETGSGAGKDTGSGAGVDTGSGAGRKAGVV